MGMEKQMCAKPRFAGPCRGHGRGRGTFNAEPVLGVSLSTHLLGLPLSAWNRSSMAFLQAVREKVKSHTFFSTVLDFNCFQLETIHVPKTHFEVVNLLPFTGSEKSPVKLEASFTNEDVDPYESYDMALTKKNKSSSPTPAAGVPCVMKSIL